MGSRSPFRIEPEFKERIWGASHLEPWFRDRPGKTGEAWFHQKDSPVLIKFLFTTENLSVQVHPGDEYARAHENCRGKTEMWHILRAEPGAKIALGLTRPLSREELRAAALDGSIMELLRWIPVSAGETYFVPAGAIHALGAGLAVCEIQQNSDVTYRLYDYGRGRELHLEQSLATADVGFVAGESPREGRLVECEYFRVDRVEVEGEAVVEGDAMVVFEGEGMLEGQAFRAGEVWRLPEGRATLKGYGRLLLVHEC